MLDNFDGKIDRNDMKYVADELFGVDRDDVDNAANIIEDCMYELGGEDEGYTYKVMSELMKELQDI